MSRLNFWTLAATSHVQRVGLEMCLLMGLFDSVVGRKKRLCALTCTSARRTWQGQHGPLPSQAGGWSVAASLLHVLSGSGA